MRRVGTDRRGARARRASRPARRQARAAPRSARASRRRRGGSPLSPAPRPARRAGIPAPPPYDRRVVRLLAIGVAAGVFSALFGVGGGAPRAAAGTSLAALAFTAAAGATAYALHGDLRPGAAAIVGIPAVLGVVAGVGLQQRLATRTLTLGFALLLAAVGIR